MVQRRADFRVHAIEAEPSGNKQGLPHSPEAERSLLGGLMLDQRAWNKIADVVRVDDFQRADHRLIFEAVATLVEHGVPPDAVTVSERLERQGQLEAVGGPQYLARLVEETPSAANTRAYAKIVREHAMLRQLVEIGSDIAASASRSDAVEIGALVHNAQRRLASLELEPAHKRAVELISGSSLNIEPIRWLWDGFLARGKFHILAGAPGTGKTTIGIALCSTLSVGGRWPDGTAAPRGEVLVWSGEDDAGDTLLPRFVSMGADLDRVHFIGDVGKGSARRAFDPSEDMQALVAAARSVSDVALLLIDPIVNALGAADSHKNTETRRALQPVVDVAAELGAAVLGISHFSKGTAARDPIERITGSIAFGALPRVVFGAARSAEDGSRRFVRCKSNIGPDGGGFEYALRQDALPNHPNVVASRVEWARSLEGPARELLAVAEATESPEERSELREAEAFLLAELAEGRMPSKKLTADARAAGISERTLKRARRSMGVLSKKDGDRWYLSLREEGRRSPSEKHGPLGTLHAARRAHGEEGQEGQLDGVARSTGQRGPELAEVERF
jgi:hypothetical protein